MKSLLCAALAALCINAFPHLAFAAGENLIYETPNEFFGSGDFDGDGRTDLVIVDKETGKFRLAYQLTPGTYTWVDNRPSGVKGIAGFAIGKLLTNTLDALVFTAADANQMSMVEASSPTASSRPITIPFTAALGPSMVVAIDIGGAGNSPLEDLYIASIYNSPDPNQATWLRNDGKEFPKLGEGPLAGTATRGARLVLKSGGNPLLCYLVDDGKSAQFRVEDLGSGKPVEVTVAADLPSGADYATGNFHRSPLRQFIFYKPGDANVNLRSVEEHAPGKFTLSKGTSFNLGDPVQRISVLDQGSGQKLFVVFGEGAKGAVFEFDGVKAPTLQQTIVATNELLTCALGVPDGLIAFSKPVGGKSSARYYSYKSTAQAYSFAAFGGLPSLADNDNITIPEIHARIVSNSTVTNEAEMRPYTNTIPGTRVSYGMVPIPGGEFVMGSPDSEKLRKPDEGPQHKVKISPFWMGRCEVTWNEYELFMYPDEEKRMRAVEPTNPTGDKLADAVTHPSKPYVEMSFGMGKEGFPAISMTQHAANKYCQWLSAKTGEFYRLPTEAEWEYACRAGTTTTYFFGDDPGQLPEYAWFEQNSEFKYQKVGKKKPNPWGLYDIYGNVVEWVLDQYDPDYYKTCESMGAVTDPWNKATKPYPHAVRGGSWDDEAAACRSGARRGSDRSWKMQDPQLPKSIWFHSDAQWVGFRVVRPLKVPPPEQMQRYWTSGVERD